jgi:D-alanyl-D-alanine carboxypeptidase
MRQVKFEASKGLRWGAFGLAALVATLAVTTDPADARSRRKRSHHHRAAAVDTYSPPYADIVVDANSGRILHSDSPDSLRHPASLTKIMTLYLLFEQLDAKKISLDTPLKVTAHAASQEPSKLGVRPGSTIEVEDAIKAVVTRSANDVAVVIAENLGGDEETFSQMMTRKARSIGMSRTTYVNASGLPDSEQITTARDQATLGRAIQERFPRYYRYFSTTSFAYRGQHIGNHNHLLGSVEGVDGIKTGYTRASGFNLVTNLRRDGRHLVAVVLGGRSTRSRDAQMRGLLSEYVQVASTRKTATMVAEADEPEAVKRPNVVARIAAAVVTPAKAEAAPAPVSMPVANPARLASAPELGSDEALKPVVVKTVAVKRGAIRTASIGAQQASQIMTPLELSPTGIETASLPEPVRTVEAQTHQRMPPQPKPGNGILGTLPASSLQTSSVQTSSVQVASAGPLSTGMIARPAPAAPESSAAKKHSGWIIQVGAFDQEGEAQKHLESAQDQAKKLLGRAEPFTEKVVKGSKSLYRARFAGLEKSEAEAACSYLKRNEFPCMAIKN